MSFKLPFTPVLGGTQSISATITSASATLATAGAASQSLMLQVTGSNPAFVRTGTGTVTATTGDMVVLPNVPQIITKPVGDNIVSAITATGAATVYATPGEGG